MLPVRKPATNVPTMRKSNPVSPIGGMLRDV